MEILRDRAEIEFPCEWEYKVIGECEIKVREAIFEVIDSEHTLTQSKVSKKGKYKSFALKLTIESHSQMRTIFEQLKMHRDIKFVL